MELTPEIKALREAAFWTGRQQAFAMIAGKCSAAKAASLKELRESRAHEPLGLTWEQFCAEYAGIGRSQADELIRRYDELGEEYFRLAEIARISTNTYRNIAPRIDGECIELDGEKIPIAPENATRIRAGLRRLHSELRDALDDQSNLIADYYHRLDAMTKDVYRLHVNRKVLAPQTGLSAFTRYAEKQFRRLSEDIEKDEPKAA
jgi:hypothetical protein